MAGPGTRRDSRETAVQFLFVRDMHGGAVEGDASMVLALREVKFSKKVVQFAKDLIEGVIRNQDELDNAIRTQAINFKFERLAAVDRNILRVAVYEMLHNPETPPAVAINEAIEIAKKLGAEDSGKFVNGILDGIRKQLALPAHESNRKNTAAPQD